MSRWSTAASVFRWIDVSISLPTSFFRLLRLFASYLTPTWSNGFNLSSFTTSLEPRRLASLLRFPNLDFSSIYIVDTVVWSVVSAVESVVLVSFLCFFFVFCGCTL
ncbi:unnamed protein product [Fraxinus pennsylvanica]|uniref:Uncharacterized protein n=1 Tax=Fraxinus pennsylvanica TaxID=56036 RepID=A0AAD1ZFZ2_9LAMI|nr:unnamed protein product [Fraxinus pennsylvanica]